MRVATLARRGLRLRPGAWPATAGRAMSSSSPPPHEELTHFGEQAVPKGDKEGLVRGVFSSVAGNYDVMNDLMSGGLHRLWKDEFVRMSGVGAISDYMRDRDSGANLAVLDLAGGTGDIAFRIARALGPAAFLEGEGRRPARLVVSDINENMLGVGQSRAAEAIGESLARELEWQAVDASSIPFDDGSFDLVTIAFGLRNVTVQVAESRYCHRPGLTQTKHSR
mmetsp:Transcript_10413/g.31229  ORF Transcript_10413/g.31229 Transcript_10413/m.31229 type:complete len:223 (+) Transcript_10413:289-957(+)